MFGIPLLPQRCRRGIQSGGIVVCNSWPFLADSIGYLRCGRRLRQNGKNGAQPVRGLAGKTRKSGLPGFPWSEKTGAGESGCTSVIVNALAAVRLLS
jgi:hypothetical protein